MNTGQHPFADRSVVVEIAFRLHQDLALDALESGGKHRHDHSIEVVWFAILETDSDQQIKKLSSLIEAVLKKPRQS